jgi:predicted nucleotidyltransferase
MELENVLKNNKDARKIFGRKEIGIILKQLKGISLTQSEKNRLSRDIRPKLRFISEISVFKDDFELKKNLMNKKIEEEAVQLILQDKLKDKVQAVLLFGSHVKGVVTNRSDVDIAVVFTSISLKEATQFRIRISSEFSEGVDIQVFDVLPQKIKKEIARTHKILFKRNDFNNSLFTTKYLKK